MMVSSRPQPSVEDKSPRRSPSARSGGAQSRTEGPHQLRSPAAPCMRLRVLTPVHVSARTLVCLYIYLGTTKGSDLPEDELERLLRFEKFRRETLVRNFFGACKVSHRYRLYIGIADRVSIARIHVCRHSKWAPRPDLSDGA